MSNIFLRKKKDQTYRVILNLSQFNQFIVYRHFKMESVHTALALMTPNCYMVSIDLKDPYYTVRIDKVHQKFLKFSWRGQLYQFTCLPMGLTSAPRIFTKITKPVFSYMGHLITGYIDDCFLLGETIEECNETVTKSVDLFSKLGFTIHPEKSVFVPSQELIFLGFKLNSFTMTVELTSEKKARLASACRKILESKCLTI